MERSGKPSLKKIGNRKTASSVIPIVCKIPAKTEGDEDAIETSCFLTEICAPTNVDLRTRMLFCPNPKSYMNNDWKVHASKSQLIL